jgi:hypothetical protein
MTINRLNSHHHDEAVPYRAVPSPVYEYRIAVRAISSTGCRTDVHIAAAETNHKSKERMLRFRMPVIEVISLNNAVTSYYSVNLA